VAGKLHALAQAVAFDIIQFPEYGGEGFVYQTDTFRYRTAKYIVQMHGPLAMFREHMAWPERGSTLDQVGCFMERTVLHHADAWLASSHCTAAFCAKLYDLDLPKIHVIHSALDTDKFAPRPAPTDERFPKILFVGNFTESKGLPALIETVIRLKGKFPKIHLRAIGKGDKDFSNELQARIVAGGAHANVDLKGYVPYAELPAHYAWCDFFAGPSEYEPGPGNVYLEAMACGRPVIAGNTGGAPEVVLAGQTGLLVPPLNVEQLTGAVATLASDAALRQRLSEQARAWVLEWFTVEKYIDRVEKIYRELLERK
jgi:glycosyltransferase involved in cell wall biosynthesis